MNKYWKYIWLLLAFGTLTTLSAEQPAIDFSSSNKQSFDTLAPLTIKYQYLPPSANDFNIDQVVEMSEWKISKDGWISENMTHANYWIGNTPKVTWIKIHIPKQQSSENLTLNHWLELASSGITEAELYVKNATGNWTIESTSRDIDRAKTRFYSFFIDKDKVGGTFFIRAEASDKFHLQLNIKNQYQFASDQSQSNFIYAICYGILLVMALYNFMIGLFLRDKLYFIYAVAIAATLFYQVFAHGHARLFYNFEWSGVNYFLNLFALFITSSAVLFMYYFCNFEQYTPKLAKLIKRFIIFLYCVVFVQIFLPTNLALNLTIILAGPVPVIVLSSSYYAWRQGSRYAGLFCISWTFYLIGGSLWLNYWLGLVPLNPWTEMPLLLGAALESVLLSLGLGYRIKWLRDERQQLAISERHYKKMSMIDPLSLLANRRSFDMVLKRLTNNRSSFGLIMLDIDNFKQFNDNYGHPAGDKVIEKLGAILQATVRENDLAARIGGEEFALLLRSDSLDNIYTIAERVRTTFESTEFRPNNEIVHSSLSIGIAIANPNETIEAVISRADKALYRAKESGRNQTQMAEPPKLT
ncbi:MAG: diguanylate cyclase [Kangiellaceae bacterium]|jgi:diguanylate cyclase (GGDEF)-like protein|nr:diguanylate cyclase [Kangiellaceae bacterium]